MPFNVLPDLWAAQYSQRDGAFNRDKLSGIVTKKPEDFLHALPKVFVIVAAAGVRRVAVSNGRAR
jgi:hypothetical protein